MVGRRFFLLCFFLPIFRRYSLVSGRVSQLRSGCLKLQSKDMARELRVSWIFGGPMDDGERVWIFPPKKAVRHRNLYISFVRCLYAHICKYTTCIYIYIHVYVPYTYLLFLNMCVLSICFYTSGNYLPAQQTSHCQLRWMAIAVNAWHMLLLLVQ